MVSIFVFCILFEKNHYLIVPLETNLIKKKWNLKLNGITILRWLALYCSFGRLWEFTGFTKVRP